MASSKPEEIILKSMSQTKEKLDFLVLSRYDLWIVWICHGIPRVNFYYFCLERTVRKDTSMRTTSITVRVIFFESGILKVTWSQFIYLFDFWLIFNTSLILKFVRCLYAFLWGSVKSWWISVFFLWRFSALKCSYYVLIFHEKCPYLITVKITLDVNHCL